MGPVADAYNNVYRVRVSVPANGTRIRVAVAATQIGTALGTKSQMYALVVSGDVAEVPCSGNACVPPQTVSCIDQTGVGTKPCERQTCTNYTRCWCYTELGQPKMQEPDADCYKMHHGNFPSSCTLLSCEKAVCESGAVPKCILVGSVSSATTQCVAKASSVISLKQVAVVLTAAAVVSVAVGLLAVG